SCRVRPGAPVPPPFPYTTLFRSRSEYQPQARVHRLLFLQRGRACRDRVRVRHRKMTDVDQLAAVTEVVRRREEADLRERWRPEADRKSTRLNSSHVKISYAVFCL